MRKLTYTKEDISLQDVVQAAQRAFTGHQQKREIKRFKENLLENCQILYDKLQDGSWKDFIQYKQLDKINKGNGKIRHINSPSLRTRIYQHLLLNILEPAYYSKDPGVGLNCKPGCGITSSIKNKSVVHKLKNLYYDRLDLKYYLQIDQRKCYDHITVKVFRKMIKNITSSKWLIDFAVDIGFINGKFPIGTPTSPFLHHILMLTFDYFLKELSQFSVRYADDVYLAFYTKKDANAAKWRVKNFWWYVLGIRAKRHTCQVGSLDLPTDFCGYIFHRTGSAWNSHNKGYTTLRKSLVKRAKQCNNNEAWASYFGILKQADAYSLMLKIEKNMKLSALTEKIKIKRSMDAKNIDIKDLLGIKITIFDYEIRKSSKGESNWIKCLIGIPEVSEDGRLTGKIEAREFHGNFQSIIQFMCLCDEQIGKTNLLPIEDVEIENQCGYIFKDSTDQIKYIENTSGTTPFN